MQHLPLAVASNAALFLVFPKLRNEELNPCNTCIAPRIPAVLVPDPAAMHKEIKAIPAVFKPDPAACSPECCGCLLHYLSSPLVSLSYTDKQNQTAEVRSVWLGTTLSEDCAAVLIQDQHAAGGKTRNSSRKQCVAWNGFEPHALGHPAT
eukprot:1160859-Pelagomonas_calceolata.AAC.5